MNRITETAEAMGARMIVLETQSCNESAIAFYRKNGFSIIGFDLYSYSNNDPERHEVRIEMGKKLQGSSKGIEHEKSISGRHRYCADPLRGGNFLFGRGHCGEGLGRRELRTSPVSASDRRLFFPAVQAGKVGRQWTNGRKRTGWQQSNRSATPKNDSGEALFQQRKGRFPLPKARFHATIAAKKRGRQCSPRRTCLSVKGERERCI